MAKAEDFSTQPAVLDKQEAAGKALFEGAYIQRVADNGAQWSPTPTGQSWRTSSGGSLWPRPTGMDPRQADMGWRQQPAWQPDGTMHRPTHVPQANGDRFDASRGAGGTIFQPRPPFVGAENPLPQQRSPQVAPGAIEATRVMPDAENGRQVGPVIISGDGRSNSGPGVYVTSPTDGSRATPADRGTPGGLIDRNGDGKLEDERSEKDRHRAEMDMLGAIGGFLVGMVRGGLRGAAVGTILGVVAAEVLRPLRLSK